MITDIFTNFDLAKLIDFLTRLGINSVTQIILIRYIYYPNNGQKESIFSYIMTGLVIFIVGSFLDRIDLTLGIAIGLFAVFSIVRFRTSSMQPKDLTYLFLIIGISIVNALVRSESSNLGLVIMADIIILPAAATLENFKPRQNYQKEQLTMEVDDLKILETEEAVKEEILRQTHLKVKRFKITRIKSTSLGKELVIWIYYHAR